MSGYHKNEAAILTREVDGELLLLDTTTDQIHQLNQTASRIWRLCDGSATIETIAKALTKEFDVSLEQARQDVAQTMRQLQDLNLITDDPSGDNPGN